MKHVHRNYLDVWKEWAGKISPGGPNSIIIYEAGHFFLNSPWTVLGNSTGWCSLIADKFQHTLGTWRFGRSGNFWHFYACNPTSIIHTRSLLAKILLLDPRVRCVYFREKDILDQPTGFRAVVRRCGERPFKASGGKAKESVGSCSWKSSSKERGSGSEGEHSERRSREKKSTHTRNENGKCWYHDLEVIVQQISEAGKSTEIGLICLWTIEWSGLHEKNKLFFWSWGHRIKAKCSSAKTHKVVNQLWTEEHFNKCYNDILTEVFNEGGDECALKAFLQ